jgi:hypothetical protein
MDSPRDPPRNKGGTPNRIGVALCHRLEVIGRSPNAGRKRVKMVKYLGHRTCLVKGPDLSDGTPNQTCPVWGRIIQ